MPVGNQGENVKRPHKNLSSESFRTKVEVKYTQVVGLAAKKRGGMTSLSDIY